MISSTSFFLNSILVIHSQPKKAWSDLGMFASGHAYVYMGDTPKLWDASRLLRELHKAYIRGQLEISQFRNIQRLLRGLSRANLQRKRGYLGSGLPKAYIGVLHKAYLEGYLGKHIGFTQVMGYLKSIQRTTQDLPNDYQIP